MSVESLSLIDRRDQHSKQFLMQSAKTPTPRPTVLPAIEPKFSPASFQESDCVRIIYIKYNILKMYLICAPYSI